MKNHDHTEKLNMINDIGFAKYFKAKSWAEYNKQFFNNLAIKYDATCKLHAFGGKAKIDQSVINKLDIPQNARILDVCAGTCDISIKIAKQYPNSKITALDASENMLNIGKQKGVNTEVNNISYICGDALKLPFDDYTFDITVISFGLRNLENLENGLLEMKRVTKSGGLVVNVDQGKPTNFLFKLLYKIYFCNIAPIIGKIVLHRGEFNSFRYLPESNKYFPNQADLVAIFEKIGLDNIRSYNYWFGAVAQQVGRRL